MIRALSIPLEVDLSSFSRFLAGRGIRHRIAEESGNQTLWVASEPEAEIARQTLSDWQNGELDLNDEKLLQSRSYSPMSGSRQSLLKGLLIQFVSAPITLSLILVTLLVAVVTRVGYNLSNVQFLFYPRIDNSSLLALLGGIDSITVFLQTLMPMFLHFGEIHLVFNLLWLWFFGKQLEARYSSWLFIAVVVFTSFVANTTQYLVSSANNFGGMSGVVYGLVGCVWVIQIAVPGSRLMLNNSMFAVFVVALIAMELIASSWIATAAHIGGLISGLLAGIVIALTIRLRHANRV